MIQTITSDSKFVRGVASQGIDFEYIDTTVAQKVANNPNVPYTLGGVKVYIHDPVPPLKNK